MTTIENVTKGHNKTVLVLGCGFTGLIIAARLLEHGFKVMVVERDTVIINPESVESRDQCSRRLPATDFNHVLMGEALHELLDWWPTLLGELKTQGAPVYSLKDWMSKEQRLHHQEADDEKPLAASLSRALLEEMCRRQISGHPQCRIIDGAEVIGLSGAFENYRYHVSGVRIKRAGDIRYMGADIIIDAMGRDSQWRRWAAELVGGAGTEHAWPSMRQLVASHYEINSQRHFLLSRRVFGFMNTLVVPAERRQLCLILDVPKQEERFWRALWAGENFEIALRAVPEFQKWIINHELQPIGPLIGYSVSNWWCRSFMKDDRAVLANYFPVGEALMSINPTWLLGGLIAVKSAKAVIEVLLEGFDATTVDRYGKKIDPQFEWMMTKVRQMESAVDVLSDAQHRGTLVPLAVSMLHDTYFGLHHLARTEKDALQVIVRSEMWLDDPVAAYQNPLRWLRHWRKWVTRFLNGEEGAFRLADRREVLSSIGAV